MFLDYQSLTVVAKTCQHIWTFVSGRGEKYHNCPCSATQTPEYNPPSFIGNNHYYMKQLYESDYDTYPLNNKLCWWAIIHRSQCASL